MTVDVDCRFSAVAQAVISYARPIVIRVPTVRPVVLLFHYIFALYDLPRNPSR